MQEIFHAGKIFNPLKNVSRNPSLSFKHIEVVVPARINNMVLDTKTLVNPIKDKVYHAGEFMFSVNVNTYAKLTVIPDGKSNIIISSKCKRPSLVKHAASIMQKTLNLKESVIIEANNERYYPHAGFGSSSSIITAVAVAINEAYRKPLSARQLVLLISQNHGEEIAGDNNRIIHVQCNGASPLAALYEGGMQLISGEATVVLREPIPEKYYFVFGIPKSYKVYDAKKLMKIEESTFPEMIKRSKDYSKDMAWKIIHEMMPAMKNHDMMTVGDVLEYYRFETGSLASDALTWPELYTNMKKLKKERKGPIKIISTSSCGPLIYALTTDKKKAIVLFKKLNMETFVVTPNNSGYTVLKRTQ